MLKNICAILFLIIGSYVYAQQTDCVEKLRQISGQYSGECKKGMAHGKGVAQGVDRYEGDFFKGLPEGKGKYTWANGSFYDGEWKNGKREGMGKMVSGDTVVNGYWKADLYKGAMKMPSYAITLSRNVARFSITKSVESGNGVLVKIMLGGNENSEVEDLSLAYTSGTEYRNVGLYGIQNSAVPVDVTIRYRTWNQLHTAQYDVVFEFTIMEPGTWKVTLTNM
jgi:hypothetical protein